MEEEIKANEPNPQMESDHIKGLSLENKSEQLDVPNEVKEFSLHLLDNR